MTIERSLKNGDDISLLWFYSPPLKVTPAQSKKKSVNTQVSLEGKKASLFCLPLPPLLPEKLLRILISREGRQWYEEEGTEAEMVEVSQDNNAERSLEDQKDDRRIKGGIREQAKGSHIVGSLESQSGETIASITRPCLDYLNYSK